MSEIESNSRIRTPRNTSVFVLGAAALGGIASVALATLPLLHRSVQVRGLEALAVDGRPASLLFAVPLTVGLSLDFRAAQRKDFTPPATRIQLARSLLYGVLSVLVIVTGASWVSPQLLPLVLAGGRVAWIPAALVLPNSVAAWALAFRRRTFTPPPLPSWRDACTALRDTNDFVLGYFTPAQARGTVQMLGSQWFVLPELGLFGNLYCLGGIGSGKTFCVVKPLLEQALFKWSGERRVLHGPPGKQTEMHTRDMRIGLLLLDYKGNNAAYVTERARALGRQADVVVLTPGGAWSINPLAAGTPQQAAQKLVAALEVMTSQQSNSYYRKMQLEFATHALSVLRDVLGPGRATLRDLYDFTTDPTIQAKFLEAAKPRASLSHRWFETQWSQEDPREQMMLTKGFRADLSQFVTPELAPTFCTTESNFPGWQSIPNDGRIVVFSMNVDEWGPVARALGIFILMDFQLQMLARTTTRFRETGGNTQRLVLCVADEVWAYMNPGLAEFTAVSREARCCTLAAHQSIDQIPPHYRATMVGNFRTPIILGINDPMSCETFSKVFGSHRVVRRTRSESAGFAGVSHGVLSESMTARAGGESRSVSFSDAEVEEPRYTPDDLTRLPKFHAVVQVFDGDVVRLPSMVSLIPATQALLA